MTAYHQLQSDDGVGDGDCENDDVNGGDCLHGFQMEARLM